MTSRDKLRRLGIALLVIVCVAGLAIAGRRTTEVDANGDAIVDSGDPCAVEISGDVDALPVCDPEEDDPGAVERLYPAADAAALQRVQVGIDLGSRYTGRLEVNGIDVPDDQLTRLDALNQVFFSPGEDRVVEEWTPGRNCVRAVYWPIADGPEDSRDVNWCFTVT